MRQLIFSFTAIACMIGVIAATLVGFVLSLKTLHQGTAVALPVSITVVAPTPDAIDSTLVERQSRGGALFPVARTSSSTWSTTEWVAGITLHYSPNSTGTVTITVGPTTREFALENSATSGASRASLTLTKDQLPPPQPSFVPPFASLINWPGEGKLLGYFITTFGLIATLCGCGIVFLLFAARRWYRFPNPLSDLPGQTNFNQVLLTGLCILLSVVAALLFVRSGPTAFDWPAMDMGPFFMRMANPSFLPNDFFTNASMVPNPRFVFGYFVVVLTQVFATDWYTVLFFLKGFIVVVTPPLILIALTGIFSFVKNPRCHALIISSLFIFVLGSLFSVVTGFFSIALWPPHMLQANAHGLSFLLAVLAIALTHYHYRRSSHGSFFVATLLHPAIGLCVLVAFLIVHLHDWPWRRHAAYLLSGVVVPFILLAILFPAPPQALTATAFADQYIRQNHAFHYFPSHFIRAAESFTPWQVNFALTSSLLFLAGCVGWRARDRFLLYTGLGSVVAYTGAIAVSYLLVGYPIKILAVLGPSRFSMMGYWLVAVVLSYLLARLLTPYATPLYHHLRSVPSTLYCAAFASAFALILYLGTQWRDNPQATWHTTWPEFSSWVATTPPDSVFASNLFTLNVSLPLYGKRAIFSGNGFPFHESSFIPYNERRSLLYGSPQDWAALGTPHQGVGSSAYFRNLQPRDFATITSQFKLDYVIIETGFSSAFSDYTPVYRDQEISVFATSDLTNNP